MKIEVISEGKCKSNLVLVPIKWPEIIRKLIIKERLDKS